MTFHDQKVSRRTIANIIRKKDIVPLHAKGGIILPTKSQKKIEYIRNPVDYTALDNVGHGVKVRICFIFQVEKHSLKLNFTK